MKTSTGMDALRAALPEECQEMSGQRRRELADKRYREATGITLEREDEILRRVMRERELGVWR